MAGRTGCTSKELEIYKGSGRGALVLGRLSLVRSALCALCDSFLVRSGDSDDDPRWVRFYEIQMSMYLLGKKNLEVSPPEGDMVHDLIRDVWEGVRAYMDSTPFGPIENQDQWFRTIHVDFPLDEGTSISEGSDNDVLLFGDCVVGSLDDGLGRHDGICGSK